jgi:ketosteroid isomerase-like protein
VSRENVEIVRRQFEAFGRRRVYDAAARRDSATVAELFDPGVEWDTSRTAGGLMGPKTVFHGYEGLRAFWREWGAAWETIEDDSPEELIDAGEHVVSVSIQRARGKASGAEVEWHLTGVWTIRDGKIVRVVWFPTRAEALEAVGLVE